MEIKPPVVIAVVVLVVALLAAGLWGYENHMRANQPVSQGPAPGSHAPPGVKD